VPENLNHLIQFRCVRAEHLKASEKERVFIHNGAWAYCPAGRQADSHQWISTGGLDRQRLESGVR
jgi:hypothetical protein